MITTSSTGPATRNSETLTVEYPARNPADGTENWYYSPDAGTTVLGTNVIPEVGLTFERTSAYFDTKAWEDYFYTVVPTSVAGPDADGFYLLTFDPPDAYPFGATDPLLVACIVELRVGRPDDGRWDDVAMTEVAFFTADVEGTYNNYSEDTLPEVDAEVVDNADAEISFVWPDRAKPGDFVYIVGSGFVALHETDPSGVYSITFTKHGTMDEDVLVFGEPLVDIDLIGARVIRCKLPTEFLGGNAVYDVTVAFQDGVSEGASTTKENALRIGQ